MQQPLILNITILDERQPPILITTTLDDPTSTAAFFESASANTNLDDDQPPTPTLTILDDLQSPKPSNISTSAPVFKTALSADDSSPSFPPPPPPTNSTPLTPRRSRRTTPLPKANPNPKPKTTPPKPKTTRRQRPASPIVLSTTVEENHNGAPFPPTPEPPIDESMTFQPDDHLLLPQRATTRNGSSYIGIPQSANIQQSLISTSDPNWRDTLPKLYQQDPFFAQIYELCQIKDSKLSPAQRAIVKYYTFTEHGLYYTNCDSTDNIPTPRLCIPTSFDNYIRRLVLFEDHDALLHQSNDKTFNRIAKLYFWPQMRKDIKRYVNACRNCRTLKTQQQPTKGFMSSPQIPAQRLSELHIDFMVGLQETPEGSDSILLAVCPLTGVLFLMPCSTSDGAIDAARALFQNVFYMHGPPTVLHSDRDSKFVSTVFSTIMSFFNIKRKMSTSYNHNPNGAAEIAIKTVEVLLRHVLSHHPDRHFTEFLPLVAYVYNSSVKNTHGYTPYYSLFGFEPSNPSILLCDALPPPTDAQLPTKQDDKEKVSKFIEHQQAVLREIKDAMQASQRAFQIFQNQNRKDVKFNPGDYVYLSTANLGQHYFARNELKFHDKFFGPFKIMEKVSDYTYRLDLPTEMKRLHNVFHTALLWAYNAPDPHLVPLQEPDFTIFSKTKPKPPVLPPTGLPKPTQPLPDDPSQLEPGEYIVEKVVSRRKKNKSSKRFQYEIKWLGFGDHENTWCYRSDAATEGMKLAFDEYDERCRDREPDLEEAMAS